MNIDRSAAQSAASYARVSVALAAMLVSLNLQPSPARADSPAPPIPEKQATITRLGFGISRITLQPRAAKRIDIQTGTVEEDASGRKRAPFSSIIYDLDGDAWVYKLTSPFSFVREQVTVAAVESDHAYLAEGPPIGSQVVTVGVSLLYGTEVGVNGE